MLNMSRVIDKIYTVGAKRSVDTVTRRCAKLIEECGETSEAFLNCTGENYKNKTWADLREELTDVFIMLADIALTYVPPDVLVNKIAEINPCEVHLDTVPTTLVHCIADSFSITSTSTVIDDSNVERLASSLARVMCHAMAQYPDQNMALTDTVFEETVEIKCNKWARQLERRNINGLAPI